MTWNEIKFPFHSEIRAFWAKKFEIWNLFLSFGSFWLILSIHSESTHEATNKNLYTGNSRILLYKSENLKNGDSSY